MSTAKRSQKIRDMVFLSMMAAIVVVLQIICTFIKFGPFSITLALAPIIVGAALYGGRGGAVLGFAFGLVVYITGLLGWDGGFVNILMGINPIATTLLCIVKGTAAGWIAALIYKPIEKKNPLAAVVTAGVAAPVVNTGLFALGILLFFSDFLSGSAAAEGTSAIALLFLGWIGINFVVELVVNMVLATVINRVIALARRQTARF